MGVFDFRDSQLKSLSDAQLIALIAGKDQDALAFVMKNYYRWVFSRLIRHGWNHEDAEELTQDTFFHFQRYAQTIMETHEGWKLGSMFAHLAAKMGRRMRVHYGRRKRDGVTISLDYPARLNDETEKPFSDYVADSRPLQDSAFLVAELMQLFPEAMRPQVEAYILQDQTGEEIAASFGKNPSTIAHSILKALERAKKKLTSRPIVTAPKVKYVLPPAPPSPKELQMELTRKIVDMHNAGMSFRRIGLILDMSTRAAEQRFRYHTEETFRDTVKKAQVNYKGRLRSRAFAACESVDSAMRNNPDRIVSIATDGAK